jgi:hypothetical protein
MGGRLSAGSRQKTKQLVARAWIDEGRKKRQNATQCVYQLIIKLGSKSLSAYIQGQSLEEFIPNADDGSWIEAFPDRQLIEAQLL